MANVIIRRSPSDPSMDMRARQVLDDLVLHFNHRVRIVDGMKHEFAVIVDGLPLLQRRDGELPSLEEVEAAVQNASGPPSNGRRSNRVDPGLVPGGEYGE